MTEQGLSTAAGFKEALAQLADANHNDHHRASPDAMFVEDLHLLLGSETSSVAANTKLPGRSIKALTCRRSNQS